jgi:hypothetical protein
MRCVRSFLIYFDSLIYRLVTSIFIVSLLDCTNFKTKFKTRGGVYNIQFN